MLGYDSLWCRKAPATNRGLEIQASPDTLDFILDNVDDTARLIGITNRLEDYFGDRLELKLDRKMKSGMLWDGGSVKSEHGLQVYWKGPECGKPGKMKVSVPARLVRRRDIKEALLFLLMLFEDFSGRFSRLDLAVDDFTKTDLFDEIQEAIKKRNRFGFRKSKFVSSDDGLPDGVAARTQYLGSPEAEKLLRIYEKFLESGGEIDSIRYELQLRGEWAKVVGAELLRVAATEPENLASWIIDKVFSGFEFRERIHTARARCPMLSWWQAFLDKLKVVPLSIAPPRQARCLLRSIETLEDQWAAQLATIEDVLGGAFEGWWRNLLDLGREKQTSAHRARAALYKIEENEEMELYGYA